MEVKLQKWGNSAGIRIPSSMVKNLGLKNNDRVEIMEEGGQIIIKKSKKKHLSFEERVQQFELLEDSQKGCVQPYDWGNDVGKEIID